MCNAIVFNLEVLLGWGGCGGRKGLMKDGKRRSFWTLLLLTWLLNSEASLQQEWHRRYSIRGECDIFHL